MRKNVKDDDLKEYEEEKRPFDDAMRQLLAAKPNQTAKKPKPKPTKKN